MKTIKFNEEFIIQISMNKPRASAIAQKLQDEAYHVEVKEEGKDTKTLAIGAFFGSPGFYRILEIIKTTY